MKLLNFLLLLFVSILIVRCCIPEDNDVAVAQEQTVVLYPYDSWQFDNNNRKHDVTDGGKNYIVLDGAPAIDTVFYYLLPGFNANRIKYSGLARFISDIDSIASTATDGDSLEMAMREMYYDKRNKTLYYISDNAATIDSTSITATAYDWETNKRTNAFEVTQDVDPNLCHVLELRIRRGSGAPCKLLPLLYIILER